MAPRLRSDGGILSVVSHVSCRFVFGHIFSVVVGPSNLCPPNIRILVHSVGSVPNIPTAAAGNGAATRSPFCLQSLPPDSQRYQHDGWALSLPDILPVDVE